MQIQKKCGSSRFVVVLLASLLVAPAIAQAPPEFLPFQPGGLTPAQPTAPLGAPSADGTSVPAPPIGGPMLADIEIGAGQPQQQQQPQLGIFPGAIPPQIQQPVGPGSSPHPTTYIWQGEKQDVTDPGPYFYHFFYTGVVQPDARVLPDDAIQRVPIRQSDWVNYRRYIIAKLTNFYQVTNNLQPTAFADYQREISGEADPSSAVIAPPPPPQPPVGFQPRFIDPNDPLSGNIPQNPQFNQFGGQFGQFGGIPAFDAKAAAEWTFYYDQLVLWQYYCTRTLLNEDTDELIDEPQPAATTAAAPITPFPVGGGGNDIDSLDGGGGFAPVAFAPAAPQQLVVREVFDPIAEYQDPATNAKLRDTFIDRAQEHEQEVYEAYIEMINRIDEEALNQEKYEQWIGERQQQILEFADNWRRMRQGETLILDNTLFLITPEKLEAPPMDAINLPKTEKLTPQDLINPDGTIKKAPIF